MMSLYFFHHLLTAFVKRAQKELLYNRYESMNIFCVQVIDC